MFTLKNIPTGLIYLRLLLGFVLIGLTLIHVKAYSTIAIYIICLGLLSDIFDGIIARYLNVSSEKLRRMDSTVDMVFWLFVTVSAFVKYPGFVHENFLQIGIVIVLEIISYIISFIKFKKEVATHAILSKIWALLLFATLLQIISSGTSGLLFQLCFYAGVASRMEIILILLLLKQWHNDVPSLFHVNKINQGKIIKRHKLFNG